MDIATITPELRRWIEDDAECATVQFIVRAVPDGTARPLKTED